MNEKHDYTTHPLDPPPSDVVGVQNTYEMGAWQANPGAVKQEMLDFLYGRLAAQQRVPVGVVEGGWLPHKDGQHVTIRMRVPTAGLLMDFAEHMEEFDV